MKKLIKIRGDKNFTTWRGGDVSRLETLTDAVFAIAITLLIVSNDVPKDYAHFKSVMWSFFGFGVFVCTPSVYLFVYGSLLKHSKTMLYA